MVNWIKENWLRILLICLVGLAIYFGIRGIWIGVIAAVLSAIAFAKAFGEKPDKEEEKPAAKDKQ